MSELVSDTKAIRKVVSRLQGREGRGLEASMRTNGTADSIASFNAGTADGIDSGPGSQSTYDANELRETLLATMDTGGADALGGEAAMNAYHSSMFSVSHLQRLQAELHLLCCESEATSKSVSEVVSKLPTEKVEALLSLLDALSDYSLSDLLRIAAYGTLRPPTSREQSERDARLASHTRAGCMGGTTRGVNRTSTKVPPRGKVNSARTNSAGSRNDNGKTASPRNGGGGHSAVAAKQPCTTGDTDGAPDCDEEDERMQRRRMALNKFRKGTPSLLLLVYCLASIEFRVFCLNSMVL